MRYYRIEQDGNESLIVEQEDEFRDLTAVEPLVQSFEDLAHAAEVTDKAVDEVTHNLLSDAPRVDADTVRQNLQQPLTPDEIWGAGVTYAISQESREGEGSISEAYLKAYEAERPEVYFKATPSRTVGPNEPIGIRGDSDWDVPEPELTVVLQGENIVGYTVGNDVCSRSLERENLLYLPQSKIYDRSCAIGPAVATVDNPHDLTIRMRIERDGGVVFEEETSTNKMVRTCEELVSYYTQHNDVPETSVLLTGTSIIPPDDVSLKPEDVVHIDIEEIGQLTNTVQEV